MDLTLIVVQKHVFVLDILFFVVNSLYFRSIENIQFSYRISIKIKLLSRAILIFGFFINVFLFSLLKQSFSYNVPKGFFTNV